MAELRKVQNHQGGMRVHKGELDGAGLVDYIAKRFNTTKGFAEVLITVAQYKPEMYPNVIQAIAEFERQAQEQKRVSQEVIETLKRIGYDDKSVENFASMLRRPDSKWVDKQRFKRLLQRLEDAKLLTEEDWKQLELLKNKLAERGYSKRGITRYATVMFDMLVELKKTKPEIELEPKLLTTRRRKKVVDKR